jgi:Tfp pilus assembly protein PilN
MTRHLDLLRTLPLPPKRPPAVSPALAALLMLVVAAGGGLAAWWSDQQTRTLGDRLQRLEATKGRGSDTNRIDPTVVAGLERHLEQRQALLAAYTGQSATSDADGARPSAWLAALAALGAPGVALETIRLEPGARLGVSGSAGTAGEVHGWIALLQQHPLTGRSAVGQLEIRAAERQPGTLAFRLVPPSEDAAGSQGIVPVGGRESPLEAAAVPADTRVARGAPP